MRAAGHWFGEHSPGVGSDLESIIRVSLSVAVGHRASLRRSHEDKTHCPLDQEARIVVSSTSRFAKMIAHKYAEVGGTRVLEDLAANHGRKVAKAFIQGVADAVATVVLAKEEAWTMTCPSSRCRWPR